MSGSRPWRGLLYLAPLALVGAELLAPRASSAQDTDHQPHAQRVARLFANKCASCHVYPDASLTTDRAWLGQIMETS